MVPAPDGGSANLGALFAAVAALGVAAIGAWASRRTARADRRDPARSDADELVTRLVNDYRAENARLWARNARLREENARLRANVKGRR